MFTFVLILIFFGCVAALYNEGLWGNAVRLINVVTAALLATNFWEPVARKLEGMSDTFASFSYYLDLLVLWGLFSIFVLVFRLATDNVSRVKLKFLKIVDRVGSAFFAVWVAWVIVSFTVFTLHTAPLAKNFMFGGFDPEKKMFLGLAPDRQWMGFVQRLSRGAFSRGAAADEQADYGTADSEAEQKLCVFDRDGNFMVRYTQRRGNLENLLKEKLTTRVEGHVPPR
jgi:uncharacterized membrane protein required for colicin V production